MRPRFEIETPKIVGMFASFSESKDHPTFISAAQEVLTKRNDVTFVAVGEGENLNACNSLVRPAHRFKIKFVRKQQNVESIVNVFDIGVLSTFTEGLPNSVMEYMALSNPVIASNVGGTCELVLHGSTGFLVKPRDIQSLVDRTMQLLGDESLATRMGMAGRERIATEFSLEKMTCSFTELYRRVSV